jgi:hypothetical protein
VRGIKEPKGSLTFLTPRSGSKPNVSIIVCPPQAVFCYYEETSKTRGEDMAAVSIELSPEKENVLRQEAARRNMPMTAYAKTLLEDNLPEQTNGTQFATPEEWTTAFQDWLASHRDITAVVLDDSRESIYGDGGRG